MLTKTSKMPWVFFLALTLVYLSLSPGSVLEMGYMRENVNAANQIISHLGNWLLLRPASTTVIWPRHGLYEILFEIPFLLLSRLLFGASPVWAEHVLSIQPVLTTSLLCTLIFVWTRQITSSLVWSYALGLISAFSTMLWPYAYIGLETTQSLFLLLSGYLALSSGKKKGWPRALFFGLSCGLAISLKSNGIFLVPSVAFLTFAYFRRKDPGGNEEFTRNWRKVLTASLIIIALYLVNSQIRSLAGLWTGGTLNVFKMQSVDGPLAVLFNLISLIASANKGLVIFCPVIFLCLIVLYKVSKTDSRLVIFAVLTLGGLGAGCALFIFWADETWGPRYLHSSIGPLFICLAAARRAVQFRFRKEILLLSLAILGTAVSFLGVFFYYGRLHNVASDSQLAIIDTFQDDPRFNHIRFDLELLRLWVRGASAPADGSELWPPAQWRWFAVAGESNLLEPVHRVDLRPFASPQPALIKYWPPSGSVRQTVLWAGLLVCLLAGLALLAVLWRRVLHDDKSSEASREVICEAVAQA